MKDIQNSAQIQRKERKNWPKDGVPAEGRSYEKWEQILRKRDT